MAQGKSINSADLNELARAFQVSTERAQAILRKRDELGGFKTLDEVKQVPGISAGEVENLKQSGLDLGAAKEGGAQQGEPTEAQHEEEEEEEEE